MLAEHSEVCSKEDLFFVLSFLILPSEVWVTLEGSGAGDVGDVGDVGEVFLLVC